jgi:hypothetical protein
MVIETRTLRDFDLYLEERVTEWRGCCGDDSRRHLFRLPLWEYLDMTPEHYADWVSGHLDIAEYCRLIRANSSWETLHAVNVRNQAEAVTGPRVAVRGGSRG